MASYNELNALIDAYINRNGVQAITGQILNGVLKAMVEQLGRGYTIMGAATPTIDPGTPDGPECYFASAPGTYTDFDGLQIVPGELALLCYTPTDGWTKETIYEGFQEVQATIDGNVGTPSVGVSYANGVLSFDFHNMKGNPGQNGQDGQDGDPAGFGTIGADITGGVGTPGVTVESSGPATAKNLQFHFTNLKGETGVTSVVATVDNTTGTPTCTVSLVGQQLTLAFSGLKGAQGDTGSSVDYPFTIVNNLTTNDATQALSAAMGVQLESQVSQLEDKVTGFAWTEGKYLNSSGNEVADAAWGITDFIPYTQGNAVTWKWGAATQVSSGRCICFYRADKTYISNGYWSAAGSTGQKTISAAGIASDAGQAAYIRASFKLGEEASVTIGDAIAWEQDGGLAQDVRKNTQDIESLDEKVSLVNKVIGEYDYKTTPDRYVRYDTGGDTASTFGVSATDFIDLGKSSSIIYSRIKVTDANSYWGIAFYNSNKEYISGQQAILNAAGYGYENTEIQVPTNAKFLRATILPTSTASGFYVAGNGGERIDKMEQEVSVIDESVISALSATQKPSPITVTWENGFYFDDTKAKLSNQNWSALTLDVEQYRLKTLSFVVNSQVGATAYGFLEDENGTTLWSVRLDGNPFSDSVFIPANAKTFKLSNRSASGDAVVAVSGYEYIDRALDVIGKIDTEYLNGKKISFLGDSITEGTGASSIASRFSSVLCDSLGAVENNLGVAGTCLANNTSNGMSSQRFVTRATQANLQDSDLVVVFGGTNDFSYDSKAIGDLFAEETITPDGRIGGKKKVAVTDTDTFAGALHELIGTIRQIIPTTPIIFVTPLNRGRYTSGRPTSAECNVNGNYLVEFADAIKEICRFYSIPVLDLNANSELDFSNSAIAASYSADSLHPNNNGHKVIAEKMEKFIFEQIVPKLVS